MITIKAMVSSDLDLIRKHLIPDFKPLDSEEYIVAKNDEGILIGFAGIWKSVDDIHITNIAVRNNFKRQGIGSLLLEKLLEYCIEYGTKAITLEVNHTNIPAIELYSKYGFEKVGTRKKYYNNIDDAIIMTLEL